MKNRFYVQAVGIQLALVTAMTMGTLKAQETTSPDSVGTARIEFTQDEWQFGEVAQGDVVTHQFKFKNSGTDSLLIHSVFSTCGCTAQQWPKEPIAPGAEGIIRIALDSKGKIGRHSKVITVKSNDPSGDFTLMITAMILPIGKN